ncbi:MAG: DUF4445 domain-containing protein [Anaerolineae bacterium]|nr:DUF4445 domain-containing protein [Anaerolineae bacterium]
MKPIHHKIVFQPSGRAGTVPAGISVLEAARRLGAGIEATCGGQGTCGKCVVYIESGTFSKYDVISNLDHVSPPHEAERRILEHRALPAYARLACMARVTGDLLVTVPPESQSQKQVVRKSANHRNIALDPAVRIVTLHLSVPNREDGSDRERVLAALAQQAGVTGGVFDYRALRALPDALRAGEGEITATLWNEKVVIHVQPGDESWPLGLAVDIGSTTLAAYLCDLRTGALLTTVSAMNPQVTYGDDIMSRISYAITQPGGRSRLHTLVVAAINELARQAVEGVGRAVEDVADLTLVGNSVMHHLLLDLDPGSLGQLPFLPVIRDAIDVRASDLGLQVNPGARAHVLPLEAGFVGADNVGVLLAEQPHRQDAVTLIIDVGTNGEIVLGNRQRLLCTSAATGPALEGAQITHGMRAAPGAIERVRIDPETLEARFKVIGQASWSDALPPEQLQARGICGSGIIEAVAELLTAGIISESGRFNKALATPRLIRVNGRPAYVIAEAAQTALESPIVITQSDVRAIQLAKAAIYVGARFLMQEFGVAAVDRIVLAGAFGSVIDKERAMIIGMIPDCDLDQVISVGNAAGDGARIALLNREKRREAVHLARWTQHVTPSAEGEFQEQFVAALALPHAYDPFPHLAAALRRSKAMPAASEEAEGAECVPH